MLWQFSIIAETSSLVKISGIVLRFFWRNSNGPRICNLLDRLFYLQLLWRLNGDSRRLLRRLSSSKLPKNSKRAFAFLYCEGPKIHLYVMAEEVGFEPTDPLRGQTISSRSRYNHFDTPPYIT